MHIGSMNELSLGHTAVSELRFDTPDGDTVIDIDEARVHLALWEIFSGRVHMTYAEVTGADVNVRRGEEQSVSLVEAFSDGSEPESNSSGGSIKLLIDEIVVRDSTLHMMIGAQRESIQDVAAIYFVSPTEENVELIAKDVSQRLYDSFHINFSSSVRRWPQRC